MLQRGRGVRERGIGFPTPLGLVDVGICYNGVLGLGDGSGFEEREGGNK